MQQHGLVQVAVTYSDLISACKKGKQPELALRVSGQCRSKAWCPTSSPTTSSSSLAKRAMQQHGVVPVAITYSALISACEKDKQPELALQVFEAMQQQGVVPDVFTCNVLISACEKGNVAARSGASCHHLQRLDQCM